MTPAWPILLVMDACLVGIGLVAGWNWWIVLLLAVITAAMFGGMVPTPGEGEASRPAMRESERRRGQAEFDARKRADRDGRERELDKHDIWEREIEYKWMANRIAHSHHMLASVFGKPDRNLTEAEWAEVDRLAHVAAERDHRQQGRRPRDSRGYKL